MAMMQRGPTRCCAPLWCGEQRSTLCYRKHSKSLLNKMVIKGKDLLHSEPTTYLKADTIYKAEPTPMCGKQRSNTGAMKLFVNPLNNKQRHNTIMKILRRCHTEPMLHQSGCFNNNIVCCNKNSIFGKQLLPNVARCGMISVAPVQQTIKC